MKIGWHTENPPEVEEKYLVQIDSGEYAIGHWGNWNRFWPQLKSDEWHWSGLPQFAKAVAWMELPEPLKVAEIEVRHIPEEADTTYCGNCKEEIEDWCTYCPNCGARLIEGVE